MAVAQKCWPQCLRRSTSGLRRLPVGLCFRGSGAQRATIAAAVDDSIEIVFAGYGFPSQTAGERDTLSVHPGGVALLEVGQQTQCLVVEFISD
jgi:hypothetical protein